MLIKKGIQISLLSLASVSLLTGLANPTPAKATTRTSYVRLATTHQRVDFYVTLPHHARYSRLKNFTITPDMIFKVAKTRRVRGHTYLQLSAHGHAFGWLNRSATVPLIHVNHDGTLAIYRHQRLQGSASFTTRRLTLTTNGPENTTKRFKIIRTMASQYRHQALPVLQKAWTDLGTYYELRLPTGQTAWTPTSALTIRVKSKKVASKPTKVVTAKHSTTTSVVTHAAKTTPPTSVTKPKTAHPTTTRPVIKPIPVKPIVFSGQIPAATIAKIDQLITTNHFMGTLLITNNGPATAQVLTYGYANVAKKIPNTKDESYPLASLEKALTGAVIQHLINQGKLTMNTPLSQFYPQVHYAQTITIRELLDHTSGIHMGEPVPTQALTTEQQQVAFTIARLTSTNQHVWFYSNANFTLLAGIIAKVTGQSFATNLQKDVLTPLHMQHTFTYNQLPAGATVPLSYNYQNNGSNAAYISTNLLSSELGCGNVYASVSDYYTFINNLMDGTLDSKPGLLELANNRQSGYAGGIYYRSDSTIRIGGSDNSFRSFYVGTNDGKIAAVLFMNQADWNAGNSVAEQIETLLAQSKHQQ